jgi:class 3 adenylate cyclase
LKVLRTYARVVKAALPKRGVVMEQTADSFYLVFNSPMDAVRSAVAIADAAAAHNSAHPDLPIRVAAGMEAGQTVRHAGGNAGAAPVVANRISDRARAGQVLLGEAAAALVRPFKVPLRDLGMTRLHDGQAMHVFEARPPFPGEVQPADRFLTTVLFTDIVQSTATATRRGREGWRELFERHHAIVREQLRRHRGVEVDIHLRFDLVADRSCAVDRVRGSVDGRKESVTRRVDIRAGVHVGECELVADKVGGIGVFVGARIKDLGGAGEILVSQAVKDVMLGSTIEFAEHGRVMLKGVPGEWTVYRVV